MSAEFERGWHYPSKDTFMNAAWTAMTNEKLHTFAAAGFAVAALYQYTTFAMPAERPSVAYNQKVDDCADTLGDEPSIVASNKFPRACDIFWEDLQVYSQLNPKDPMVNRLVVSLPGKEEFKNNFSVGPAYDTARQQKKLENTVIYLGIAGALQGGVWMRRRLRAVDELNQGIDTLEQYANKPE